MPVTKFDKSTIKFLKDLSKNNNREWFKEKKPQWELAKENLKDFLSTLEYEMNKVDDIEKSKLFRIYRDVRFSKDKTPYNIHYSMSLNRAGADKRGGYYLRVDTEKVYIGCGFWKPEPADLKLIREHISVDTKAFRKVINSKKITNVFGPLQGEQVKTTPKGYDKNHQAIDLLKHKQFLFFTYPKLSSASQDDFLKNVVKTFKTIKPFFDHMSYILTHDLNGVSTIKK